MISRGTFAHLRQMRTMQGGRNVPLSVKMHCFSITPPARAIEYILVRIQPFYCKILGLSIGDFRGRHREDGNGIHFFAHRTCSTHATSKIGMIHIRSGWSRVPLARREGPEIRESKACKVYKVYRARQALQALQAHRGSQHLRENYYCAHWSFSKRTALTYLQTSLRSRRMQTP